MAWCVSTPGRLYGAGRPVVSLLIGGRIKPQSNVVMLYTKYRRSLLWAALTVGVMAVPTVDMGAAPGQKKVRICHKGQTLEVAEPAVEAHLRHGDTLGPCEVTPDQNR